MHTPAEIYAAWDTFQAKTTEALMAAEALRPMLEQCPNWENFQNGYVGVDQILIELVLFREWPERT